MIFQENVQQARMNEQFILINVTVSTHLPLARYETNFLRVFGGHIPITKIVIWFSIKKYW